MPWRNFVAVLTPAIAESLYGDCRVKTPVRQSLVARARISGRGRTGGVKRADQRAHAGAGQAVDWDVMAPPSTGGRQRGRGEGAAALEGHADDRAGDGQGGGNWRLDCQIAGLVRQQQERTAVRRVATGLQDMERLTVSHLDNEAIAFFRIVAVTCAGSSKSSEQAYGSRPQSSEARQLAEKLTRAIRLSGSVTGHGSAGPQEAQDERGL